MKPNHLRSHTTNIFAVANGAAGNSNTATALAVDDIDFSKTNGNTITVPAAHLPAAGDVANGANSNTVTATAPAAPAARALQAVGNGAIGNSNTATALAVDDIDFSKTNGDTITVPAAHLPAAGDVANGANSNTVTATAPAARTARALQAVGNGAIGNSNTAIVLAAADVAAANGAKANSNTITAAAIGDVANGANGNTVTA